MSALRWLLSMWRAACPPRTTDAAWWAVYWERAKYDEQRREDETLDEFRARLTAKAKGE
jgi:hypothetical protein